MTARVPELALVSCAPVPRLIHLAPEHLERRIQRSGLRGRRCSLKLAGTTRDLDEAVFAMPVLADESITYQWLRELRMWRRGRMVAVMFRLGGDELVYAGRYNREKTHGPLSELVRRVMHEPWGAEIIVPRAVTPKEVLSIRHVRQDVGWVEQPGVSHKYDCVCIMCLPAGSPRLKRRLRRTYQAAVQRIRNAVGDEEVLQGIRDTHEALERGGRFLPARPLVALTAHPNLSVRRAAVRNLAMCDRAEAEPVLVRCLGDADVEPDTLDALLDCVGASKALQHVQAAAPQLLLSFVEALRYCTADGSQALRALADCAIPEVASAAREVLKDRYEDSERDDY